LANIRGGGEYGPRWHQAALKENRHRAYEDFSSVAEDLLERGVTDRDHLAVRGGSNGGLLAGNMVTRYPELFGVVIIQVPLLDMKRYSPLLAGASWMAEYGDPDTEDWEHLRTFSPYHLLTEDRAGQYPPTFVLTSTRDDRVHPGHARKFTAAMESLPADVRYWEDIEGGHGGAATNEQAARVHAQPYTFLGNAVGAGCGHRRLAGGALRAAAAGRPGRRVRTAPVPDTGARSLTSELFDRSAQDDLLQLRNDLMTVYREFSAEDPRLFPLRYARTVPRRPRPASP